MKSGKKLEGRSRCSGRTSDEEVLSLTVTGGMIAGLFTGRSRFYKITLFTGSASSRGAFRDRDDVVGIAIPLNQL